MSPDSMPRNSTRTIEGSEPGSAESPIARQLSAQEYRIDSVFAILAELRQRLSPVSSQEVAPYNGEEEKNMCEPSPGTSEYVDRLSTYNRSLKEVEKRIAELMSDLEI